MSFVEMCKRGEERQRERDRVGARIGAIREVAEELALRTADATGVMDKAVAAMLDREFPESQAHDEDPERWDGRS